MDVFNIAGGQAPRAAGSEGVDPQKLAHGAVRGRRSDTMQDSFSYSADVAQVRARVDALVGGDDVRVDMVDKFSALLKTGELDSFASAQSAAAAMLGIES